MSRIISFAWTTPALVTGHKLCTRRDWKPSWALGFKEGDLVDAYNRSQRARGIKVADIRLTQTPAPESMADMPDEDYDNEGFRWMLTNPEALPRTVEGLPRDHFMRQVLTWEGFNAWRSSGEALYVVRFALVGLTEQGEQIREQLERASARQ